MANALCRGPLKIFHNRICQIFDVVFITLNNLRHVLHRVALFVLNFELLRCDVLVKLFNFFMQRDLGSQLRQPAASRESHKINNNEPTLPHWHPA